MLDPTDSGVTERWRALWDASPQRSPFSRLEYVRSVAGAAGLHVGIHFASNAEGDTVGAAVTWRRRGPYREVIVPPFTPFSAMLLASSLSEAAVHARSTAFEGLLEMLEGRYHAVHLHLPPSLTDVRPAQWKGWTAEPLYTYRLTVSTGVPDSWSSSAARNYRTARVDFELVEGEQAADAAVHLAAESYVRRGRALPLEEARLRDVVKELMTKRLASSFAVRRGDTGAVEAGVVAAHADRCAFYWIAGSRPGDGMTVLVGEMLSRLLDAGFETFDFVGANTPGIAEFKRRFGAKLVPYFRITTCTRLELKLLYMFRNMVR